MYDPSTRRRRSDAITEDDSVAVRLVGFKIDEASVDELDELASLRGVKRSKLIREVLLGFIADQHSAQSA